VAPSAHHQPLDDALAAQVAARDVASREDAAVLAPLRSEAAARALGFDLPEGRLPAVPLAGAMPLPTPVAPADRPAPDRSSADGTEPVEEPLPIHEPPSAVAAAPAVEHAPRPLPPGVVVPTGGPAPVVTGVLAKAREESRRADGSEPLMQVLPTVLATDVDRIGDQLIVLKDRLELRDRHNGLRRTVDISDIVDIEIQHRLTSAVLVVTTRTGSDMVIKGLRPDSAESARRTILDLVPDEPALPPGVDERVLVKAILDLHRAGVLDDTEAAEKTATVARLVGRPDRR
jgi:hypothetical protein